MKLTRFLLVFAVLAVGVVAAQAAGLDAQSFITPDMQMGLAAAGAAGITKFHQDGHCLDLTPTAAVASGVGFLFGTSLFGVAVNDVAANVEGVFLTEGVVTIGKTAGLAISVGDRLYWDPAGKVVNKTATAQQHVGICTVAALAGDSTVKMKLSTTVALAA